jgi:hypothetical protein
MRHRSPRALLVVGDDTVLTAGDTAVQARLVSLGCSVTVIDDGAAEPSTRYDIIVIADSVSGTNLTTTHKYKANTAPRLCCSFSVATDWAVLTAAGSNTTTATTIVLDGYHPASGRLPVTTSTFTISTDTATNNLRSTTAASIVAGGVQIAKVNGGNPCIAAFDKATVVSGGVTTERIVAFGIRENAFAHPTTHTWIYFDAAINWLLYRDRRAFLPAPRPSTFTLPVSNAIYVDPDTGSDAANGLTAGAPVQTIVHAAALVPSGGTIVLRGAPHCSGVYRESLGVYSTKPLKIQGYLGEGIWIKGTSVITSSNFVASGSAWKWAGAYNPTALNGKRAASTRQQTITDATWDAAGANPKRITSPTAKFTTAGFTAGQPVTGPVTSSIASVDSATQITLVANTVGSASGAGSVTFAGSNLESSAADLTDQLIFDGESFYQVDALAKMTARTFFIDYSVGATGIYSGAGPFDVYIGQDPTGHVVEMSQYVNFAYFQGSAINITVRGVGICQFSSNYDNDSTGKAAALGFNSTGCTADQNMFWQNAGHDLQGYGHTTVIRDCEYGWTGYAPITGNDTDGLVLAGLNWLHDCNRNRQVEVSGVSSHIGAFKMSNTQGITQAAGAGAAYWGEGWQAEASAQTLGAIVIDDPYGLHGFWLDLHCSHSGLANIIVRRPGKNNHGGVGIWHEYGDTGALFVNCTVLSPYNTGLKTGESVGGRFWNCTVKDFWVQAANVYGDSRQNTTGAEMCNNLFLQEDSAIAPTRVLYINDQVTAHTQSVAGMVSKVDGNGYARAVSTAPTNLARVDTTDTATNYATAALLTAAFAALEPAAVSKTTFAADTALVVKHKDDLRQVATSDFLAAGVGVAVPADVAAILGVATSSKPGIGALTVAA